MTAEIIPSKIQGSIKAPASKSMAHRYIICACFAKGLSRIENISYSEDIKSTLDCIQALGAKVTRGEDYVEICGINPCESFPDVPLFVRESGSTLRFLIPAALLSGNKTEFCGKERLFQRPLGVYQEIANEYGFTFDKTENSLTVCGRLKPGTYKISDNKSSQFISGLLFALPVLSGDSEIILSEHPESKPYIDMTLEAMREFGVCVDFDGDKVFKIRGGQGYRATDKVVEGDCSNAAFFQALNLVGGNVTVTGLREDTLQGDAIYGEYFEKIMNGNGKAELDITDCPDLAPILLALLAQHGGGKLKGTARLKFKESDRGEVMKCELSKFGANILCHENEIEVAKTTLHAPTEKIKSHSDHRVVMACAVLMTKYGGEIDGCEDCAKSMPDFFQCLEKLGANIKINQGDETDAFIQQMTKMRI